MTHEGYLRHLLVRKAVKTQQILVDVVTTTQIEFDMAELAGIFGNCRFPVHCGIFTYTQ